jgi:hypothetical protein
LRRDPKWKSSATVSRDFTFVGEEPGLSARAGPVLPAVCGRQVMDMKVSALENQTAAE